MIGHVAVCSIWESALTLATVTHTLCWRAALCDGYEHELVLRLTNLRRRLLPLTSRRTGSG
jgi:hypothetical protein